MAEAGEIVADWNWAGTAAAAVLGVGGAAGLLPAGRSLRGTTLMAAWRWACFSFVSLAACELLAAVLPGTVPPGRPGPAWLIHVRYLAGMTTLTPFVALLGAKRPQDRAWQWIVLALVLLLAIPSTKAVLFDAGAAPAPHAAWRLLMAVLLIAQLVNYLPTRFWLAALFLALAQLGWLGAYLPGVASGPIVYGAPAGLALAVAAIATAHLPPPRRRRQLRPTERVWLDFRDAYGVLWALRVAERVNASAARNGWPTRLGWSGMRPQQGNRTPPGNEGPEATAALEQNLLALLRRFVSRDWIDV